MVLSLLRNFSIDTYSSIPNSHKITKVNLSSVTKLGEVVIVMQNIRDIPYLHSLCLCIW
jgi:hypothetical protein